MREKIIGFEETTHRKGDLLWFGNERENKLISKIKRRGRN